MKDAGQSPENTVYIAGQRAGEAFDRRFHLSRIRAAGITLDDHPEYRSYQKLYELGMAPPPTPRWPTPSSPHWASPDEQR